MRRHSWKTTESQRGFDATERCVHCGTERVSDPSTKTLYEYRGGRAEQPNRKPLPDDRWVAFLAGVIPRCVER